MELPDARVPRRPHRRLPDFLFGIFLRMTRLLYCDESIWVLVLDGSSRLSTSTVRPLGRRRAPTEPFERRSIGPVSVTTISKNRIGIGLCVYPCA